MSTITEATCARNAAHGPAEVPWTGGPICWDCADRFIDLIALACELDGGLPVEPKNAQQCTSPAECARQACAEHPRHDGSDHTWEQHHAPEDHAGGGECLCTAYAAFGTSTTGYPLDGYDGSDESFERLQEAGRR